MAKPVGKSNLRRHLRFEVDSTGASLTVNGLLSLIGIRGENKARAVLNLSEGGALVVVHEPVPRGSKVRVRVEMERYQDVFVADGVVRWCAKHPRKDGFHQLGVQFTNLSDAQARKLTKMREWFTSPQYLARVAERAKNTIHINWQKH
ncbi:MAG TPA: PilZ domain-containing protein [Planctomycetota bacterium]|nr:PilZ domain-containing protein [Planctomycetota bacterium]